MRFLIIIFLSFISCNNYENEEYLESLKNPNIYPFGIKLKSFEKQEKNIEWPYSCPIQSEIYEIDSNIKVLTYIEDCFIKGDGAEYCFFVIENNCILSYNNKNILPVYWTEDSLDWSVFEEYLIVDKNEKTISEFFYRDTVIRSSEPNYRVLKNVKFKSGGVPMHPKVSYQKIFSLYKNLEEEFNINK